MAVRQPQGLLPPIPAPIKVFIPGTSEAQHAGEGIVHAGKSAEKGVEDVGHVAVSVSDFLGKLSDPHMWVRIGEVLVGSILLIVGMDHIFGTDMTGKAAKAAPFLM